MVFEGCCENNVEDQMMTCVSDNGGYHFWFQGSLNLLTREQRANYIAAILLRILEFLSV